MVFRMIVVGLLGAIVLQLASIRIGLMSAYERSEPVEPSPAVIHVSKAALERYGVELEIGDGVTNRRVQLVLEP